MIGLHQMAARAPDVLSSSETPRWKADPHNKSLQLTPWVLF